MIKEVTMYTVICDNCGKDSNEGSDYSCWNTPTDAIDVASDSNWTEESGKHYCADCWSYDDSDNLVVNKSRTNTPQS